MSNPDRPLVSILVVSWNGLDLLERYFGHVVERTLADDPRHEIILVDNGSVDETMAFVTSRFPGVKTLRLEQNQGFGGGANAGARLATHPILAILNNDAEPTPGFLQPLPGLFADPALFAVMARSLVTTRDMQEEAAQRLRFRRGRLVPVTDPAFAAKATSTLPILYASGGMMAFHREHFMELGGFDDLFRPAYWEDVDLSMRAWRRGWKVLYEPSSVMHHQHRATNFRPELRAEYLVIANRNWHLFAWKHLDGARLWSRYAAWEAAYILHGLLTGDPLRLKALFRALPLLPRALRGRAAERAEGATRGSEILARFGALEWLGDRSEA
ncbi:MAG: glycosyltransferase [Candidatus Wallbacteria bacterium]|nr:glycosyltransferase [Candidatus Wallbacteria bacterium]